MGLPITYANLSDLRATTVISNRFIELWNGASELPQHPAFVYGGSINGRSSTVVKVGHAGISGYDLMSATAEGTAATTQTLTTGSTSVTVARYVLQREVGDLARMTDEAGLIQAQNLAQGAFMSYKRTFLDAVCSSVAGFSTAQTASTILTVADILAAKATLAGAGGQGPYICLLHPKQWGDIEAEVTTTNGGSIAHGQAAQAVSERVGDGFVGRFLGIDFFTSTSITSSGGNYLGALLAPGAIAYADGVAPIDDPASQFLVGNQMKFSRTLQPTAGTNLWVAEGYLGVARAVSARAVKIVSDT